MLAGWLAGVHAMARHHNSCGHNTNTHATHPSERRTSSGLCVRTSHILRPCILVFREHMSTHCVLLYIHTKGFYFHSLLRAARSVHVRLRTAPVSAYMFLLCVRVCVCALATVCMCGFAWCCVLTRERVCVYICSFRVCTIIRISRMFRLLDSSEWLTKRNIVTFRRRPESSSRRQSEIKKNTFWELLILICAVCCAACAFNSYV